MGIINRLQSLDVLRGVAALWVFLVHIPTPEIPMIDTFFENGHYGVHIFFILSGFIIPYSISKGYKKYSLKGFFNFLWRRLIRIVPPSTAALLYLMAIDLMAIYIKGSSIDGFYTVDYNISAFFSNMFYYAPLVESEWYLPVFWTLAVEAQYYLIIGGLMFFFCRDNLLLDIGVVFVVLLMNRVNGGTFLFFNYAPLFALGIWYYVFLKHKFYIILFYTILIFMLLYVYLSFGWITTVVSLFTLLTMHYLKRDIQPFSFLGDISYSFYLTHAVTIVVGQFIINQIPFLSSYNSIFAMLLYLILSTIVAYAFYMTIEKWSISLGRIFKIKT